MDLPNSKISPLYRGSSYTEDKKGVLKKPLPNFFS
jgi:hypothetical protein